MIDFGIRKLSMGDPYSNQLSQAPGIPHSYKQVMTVDSHHQSPALFVKYVKYYYRFSLSFTYQLELPCSDYCKMIL
jgi:hypothetical protein